MNAERLKPDLKQGATLLPLLLWGLAVFTVAALLTGVAYYSLGKPLTGVDDANIFLVYGRNLAGGHGFVYNAGGERVEGFSSLLWVLMIAALFRIVSAPEALLLALNVVLVTLGLTTLVRFLEERFAAPAAGIHRPRCWLSLRSVVFLGWVFAAPGYLLWSTLPLMETGLWGALLLIASTLVLDAFESQRPSHVRRRLLALVLPLLILTRPEGPAWALLFCVVYALASLWQTGRWREAAAQIVPSLSVCIVTALGVTLFRMACFGYPLPNTYYAKVSPDLVYDLTTGGVYFLKFLSSNGFIQVNLIAAGMGVVQAARAIMSGQDRPFPVADRQSGAWLASSLIALWGLIVPVLVGGDHFDLFRFYQPIWPLLIMPAMYAFVYLRKQVQIVSDQGHWNQWRYLALVSLLLLFAFGNNAQWQTLSVSGIKREFTLAQVQRTTGRALNELFADRTRPAVGEVVVGGLQYAYEGPVVDLMGLNNVAMAHAPGDRKGIKNHAAFSKEVFYQQRPDLLLPMIISASFTSHPYRNAWANTPLRGLLTEARFLELYTAAGVRHSAGLGNKQIAGYFRNDYLATLRQTEVYEITIFESR